MSPGGQQSDDGVVYRRWSGRGHWDSRGGQVRQVLHYCDASVLILERLAMLPVGLAFVAIKTYRNNGETLHTLKQTYSPIGYIYIVKSPTGVNKGFISNIIQPS